jgi:hypothetical protein
MSCHTYHLVSSDFPGWKPRTSSPAETSTAAQEGFSSSPNPQKKKRHVILFCDADERVPSHPAILLDCHRLAAALVAILETKLPTREQSVAHTRLRR